MTSLMEKRVDIILRNVREQTGNAAYTPTQGVRQRELVRYINDGQERIYNKILQEHPTLFTKIGFIDTVAGQASYALPSDVYLKHNIVTVHFSYNGQPINYAPMDQRSARQEISVRGFPGAYFLRDGNITLIPIPSNSAAAALRIYYQYSIPSLDIRRFATTGTFITFGGSSGSRTISALTIFDPVNQDVFPTLPNESLADLLEFWVDALTLVDAAGNQVAGGLNVSSGIPTYVPATGALIPATAISITDAQYTALQAVGGNVIYILFGANATTNSTLPQVCERYLTDYAALRTQMRDSNKEAVDTSPILMAIETDILDAISDLEEDITSIAILDYSTISYADEI